MEPLKQTRRSREIKAWRREEAEARAKEYKQPENPKGMREKVKRGLMSINEALDILANSGKVNSEKFTNWLHQKKKNKFKAKTSKPKSEKKAKKKSKNAHL